jgi:hypothetical protein
MKDKTGETALRWKGGTYNGGGYVYILLPDHPHALKNGYIGEHIVIAERSIGRYLNKGEVVHHINKIKNDNRPDNLMVLTNSSHSKAHGILKKINENRDRYGEKNPFWGKHHNDETKRAISAARAGKPLSEEHREHMRIARRRYLENASHI